MDFIVDAMLGRLAVWLRLTGNDTLYSPDIRDEELLNKAEKENRAILTSDSELCHMAKKRDIECMLLEGSVDERVARVFQEYDIEPRVDPTKSRCSKCNGKLIEIPEKNKRKIKELVYEQTYNHYDRFWLCKECNSVYFQGGYWSNIKRYMRKIRQITKDRLEAKNAGIAQEKLTEEAGD